MMEVHKVWQVMNSHPLQRLLGLPALMKGREHFAVDPDLRMAAQAEFAGWHTCRSFSVDRAMAVLAVDPDLSSMMLVAEGNGLRSDHANFREIRRANQNHRHAESPGNNEHRPEDTHPGNRVGTGMKDLCHSTVSRGE